MCTQSLPSIFQTNTLIQAELRECVNDVPTFTYTYTVSSCIFDSTMFYLLTSEYFEMIIKYIDGLGLTFLVY